MGRLTWSIAALEDAEAIAEYIARDSVDGAALFITRLHEAAEHIASQPEAGRIIPELNARNRREILVGPYRVMYRQRGNDVAVTAIVHGARNWPNPPMK